MIVHNGNIVVNNGRWINCSQPYSIKRHVNILSTPGGTITAEPVEGYDGYVVKLSHTDNPYYTFMNYNVSGARLYNDRYFRFEGSDVTVSGTWQFSTKWLCDNWVKISPKQYGYTYFSDSIWTNKNLEVDDGGPGIYKVDNVIGRDGTNFGTQYYYTFEAAKRIVDTIPGWHLPRCTGKYYEVDTWDNLDTHIKVNNIKSDYGWYMPPNYYNGNNSSGFNALPVGFMLMEGGSMILPGYAVGQCTWFVSASQTGGGCSPAGYSYVAAIQYDANHINDNGSYVPSTHYGGAYSVRLVKDDINPPVCV